MCKVLLINPPTPFLGIPNAAPHLGIGYLISYLRMNGIDVKYMNLENIDPDSMSIPEGYDFYGITSVTPQYYYAKLVLSQISKRESGKTIIGGAHASLLPEQCHKDGFDYIVKGFGEIALLDIVRGRYAPGSIIQGTPVIDLDSLPYPAWDDLLETPYDVSFEQNTGFIFSTRGCTYKCYYCCSPLIYGQQVHYRSVNNVISEIIYLKERYKIDSIYFLDPTFTLFKDINRINELTNELKDLDIKWTCQTRVDQIDEKILKTLRQGGCKWISFGVETFSDDLFTLLGKETTARQNELAIKMAHDAGLKVKSYLMGSLPNENWESSERFKEFITKNKPDSWLYSTFVPLPGTRPWLYPERFGVKILCRDFRTYYPLGINGRGPVNIRNKYLHRDELLELRDNMINFLRELIPNKRIEKVIIQSDAQRKKIAPYLDGLKEEYVSDILGDLKKYKNKFCHQSKHALHNHQKTQICHRNFQERFA